MNKSDFIKEAKKIGYTQEEIEEWVALYEQASSEGVELNWEFFLIERQIED